MKSQQVYIESIEQLKQSIESQQVYIKSKEMKSNAGWWPEDAKGLQSIESQQVYIESIEKV